MKRKTTFKFLLISGIFLNILSSCNDINLSNISKDVMIDESLVLPIANGSIKISDILAQIGNQNQIVNNGDTISYVSNYSYDYAFNNIDLLSNAQSAQLSIPLAAATIPANTNIPLPGGNNFLINLGLDPNSTTKRVDSVYVTSATIAVTISVANLAIIPSDLKITLVFPTMKNQSDRSQVSKVVTYSTFGQPFNLLLNNVIVNSFGQTGVPVQVLFSSGNRSITVNSNSAINVGLKFINPINFTAAYGLFQPSAVGATTIKMPLDILKSLPVGLKFANPKAYINLQSNIGSYLRFNIDYVKAYSKDKLTQTQASFNGSPSTYEIINKLPSSPGQFVNWNMKTLDKDYGATDLLFDTTQPLDTLEYKFSLGVDPSTPPASYIIPGMKLKANVKIQIPLYLKAGSYYSVNDTVLNIGENISKIEQGTLILKITNGLPVKATYSMKFLDSSKHLITTSLNDSTYVINSGQVDSNGLVTAGTVTPLNIALTKSQITSIGNAKYMVFTVRVEGQDATKAIQFTNKDYFNVKLGIFVKASTTTTLGTTNK